MKIERTRSRGARKAIVILVLICLVTVVVAVFGSTYFTTDKVAARTMQKMAADYYENYFYDRFLDGYRAEHGAEATLEEAFGEYAERGFPAVLLRRLLLFDNSKWNDYRAVFDQDGFKCDTNTTTVVFKPVAPFGKTDYTTTYSYSCKSS